VILKSNNARHVFSILLVIILTSIVYTPGLSDFWLADDITNIVNNNGIKIESLDSNSLLTAATANDSGPLKRPLASLSFALNYYFSDQKLIASHFKATNIGIHVANSILIYILTLSLLTVISKRVNWLPSDKTLTLTLLITLLWALHPIQLTAVLYSVQRMTSMATFFMLAGLITYIWGRNRIEDDRPHAQTLMYSGIILGTALGALCKEIALLLPFYAMAIELTLYYRSNNKHSTKKKLKLFHLSITIIPAVIGIIYLASHPDLILGGYKFRDFTVLERLLTEPRVLFYYIGLIIYPNLGELSLHHDDILISQDLLTPATTIFALLGIVFLLVAALFLRKKHIIISFMVIWFLVGHAMESTIFGLEIAYEHRNYLPSYSIIFGAILLSYLLLKHITNNDQLKTILAIVALTSTLITTFTLASIWSREDTIAQFDIKNHPDSVRSQMSYAEFLFLTGQPLSQVYEHTRIAARLTTSELGPIILLYRSIKTIEKNIDNYSADYVESTKKPISYDAPLIINSDYIIELEKLIDHEISRRLQGEIATHRAAMAFKGLSNCIENDNPHCTPLTANAINWLTILTNNARHSPKSLAATYFHLAKLKAYTGDISSAFFYLDKSSTVLPDDFSIVIYEINLHLTVGNLNNAQNLISKLDKKDDIPENFKRDLNNSKVYLQTLRNNIRTDNKEPQPNQPK